MSAKTFILGYTNGSEEISTAVRGTRELKYALIEIYKKYRTPQIAINGKLFALGGCPLSNIIDAVK